VSLTRAIAVGPRAGAGPRKEPTVPPPTNTPCIVIRQEMHAGTVRFPDTGVPALKPPSLSVTSMQLPNLGHESQCKPIPGRTRQGGAEWEPSLQTVRTKRQHRRRGNMPHARPGEPNRLPPPSPSRNSRARKCPMPDYCWPAKLMGGRPEAVILLPRPPIRAKSPEKPGILRAGGASSDTPVTEPSSTTEDPGYGIQNPLPGLRRGAHRGFVFAPRLSPLAQHSPCYAPPARGALDRFPNRFDTTRLVSILYHTCHSAKSSEAAYRKAVAKDGGPASGQVACRDTTAVRLPPRDKLPSLSTVGKTIAVEHPPRDNASRIVSRVLHLEPSPPPAAAPPRAVRAKR
jgi:hypothetical protein